MMRAGKVILVMQVSNFRYYTCPTFSQCDWLIIGQDSAILPDGLIQLPNKTENVCLTKCLTKLSQILGKLRKIIKLGKMLLIKLVSDYLRIDRKL